MADQTVNYKCPACTGPLHFSTKSQKLECEYCGSTYELAEIEALYGQKEEQAAAAQAKEEAHAHTHEGAGEQESIQTSAQNWGSEGKKLKQYNCTSCGAELICDENTAATQCPYCGNPTIVPGQFSDQLKPEYVIPFALDKKQAMEALKKHYSKRLFLPKAFKTQHQIEKLQGIYVPFWLYNSSAFADCVYTGTRSRSHREGDYIVKETDHFHAARQGQVDFTKIPVDASSKMDDDLMDSIEPFDYAGLKPFSTAYLPGFMADRYDVSQQDCAARASNRVRTSAIEAMQADLPGYETLLPIKENVGIRHKEAVYALLPVWYIVTKWKGNTYQYAMNGQTGVFTGNLPVDKSRFWIFFLVLSVVFSLLLYLVGFGRLVASMFA